jgi:glycosyltransferase involved in cell wall biosynthesis
VANAPNTAARDVTSAVSVILVVRNGAAFIESAIASVESGSVTPAEILVIDGHSTDDTVAIATRHASVCVHTQHSIGIAGAYNEGIRRASNELIAFISHDDRWAVDKLETQLAFLHDHPEAWGCVGHVQHFLDPDARPPAGFRVRLLEQSVPGFVMESLIARRALFNRVGMFDESIPSAHDTDWFARVRDAGLPIGLVPGTVLQKRVHGRNTSLHDQALNAQLLRAMHSSIRRKRATTGEDTA